MYLLFSNILSLTPENFTQSTIEPALIKFYAPWCGHCKQLAPEFQKLTLKDTKFQVFEVDCSLHQSLCEINKVSGFPTILYINNGNHYFYEGDRQVDKIIAWTEKMSLPVLQTNTTIDTTKPYFIVQTPNPLLDEQLFSFAKGQFEILAELSENRQIIAKLPEKNFYSDFSNARNFMARFSQGIFPELTVENFDILASQNLKIAVHIITDKSEIQTFPIIAESITNFIPCWLNATALTSFASNFNAEKGGKTVVFDSRQEKFYVKEVKNGEEFLSFLKEVESGKAVEFEVSSDSSKLVKYANFILLGICVLVVGCGMAFAWRCFSQKIDVSEMGVISQEMTQEEKGKIVEESKKIVEGVVNAIQEKKEVSVK